jgi:hypothetical protein
VSRRERDLERVFMRALDSKTGWKFQSAPSCRPPVSLARAAVQKDANWKAEKFVKRTKTLARGEVGP